MRPLQAHDNASARQALQPDSICIVGCGLIGMSMAIGLRRAFPDCWLVGMDIRADHRAIASEHGVFSLVQADWPEGLFDLIVLAVPAGAATRLLQEAGHHGRFVMDVCSIKVPLCSAAREADLSDRFAPTHPMAGIASEGPREATGDLFQNQTWVLLRNWSICALVEPLVRALGANPVWLDSDMEHDAAMAAVSHGIHVTSLSAMLAYEEANHRTAQSLARVTGPGFRDITRLAASPSEFWVDTLLANGDAVVQQLTYVSHALEQFRAAILERDRDALRALLDAARESRKQWAAEREGI